MRFHHCNMPSPVGPVGSSLTFNFSGKFLLQLILSDLPLHYIFKLAKFPERDQTFEKKQIRFVNWGNQICQCTQNLICSSKYSLVEMKYLWIRLQRRVTIWVFWWDALIIDDNHCLFVQVFVTSWTISHIFQLKYITIYTIWVFWWDALIIDDNHCTSENSYRDMPLQSNSEIIAFLFCQMMNWPSSPSAPRSSLLGSSPR